MKRITIDPLSAVIGAGLLALALSTASARQVESQQDHALPSPHGHAVLWWLVDRLVQDQLDLRSHVWAIEAKQAASRADEQAIVDDEVRTIYQAKLWDHEYPTRTEDACTCVDCVRLMAAPGYAHLRGAASILSMLDLSDPSARSMVAAADQRMFDKEGFAPVRDEARAAIRDLLADGKMTGSTPPSERQN